MCVAPSVANTSSRQREHNETSISSPLGRRYPQAADDAPIGNCVNARDQRGRWFRSVRTNQRRRDADSVRRNHQQRQIRRR